MLWLGNVLVTKSYPRDRRYEHLKKKKKNSTVIEKNRQNIGFETGNGPGIPGHVKQSKNNILAYCVENILPCLMSEMLTKR